MIFETNMKCHLSLFKSTLKRETRQKQVCIMVDIKRVCDKRTYPEEQDVYTERKARVTMFSFSVPGF